MTEEQYVKEIAQLEQDWKGGHLTDEQFKQAAVELNEAVDKGRG